MQIVSDLNDHTGYLLRVVSNAVSQEFARRAADEGVTVAEWTMLRSLYGKDATAPSELARTMGLTRGAISKLADRLLGKGLLQRTGNPDDKRGHSLSLSLAGMQKVPALAAMADGNDAALFGVLAQADQQRLRALLQELIHRHRLTATAVD